MVFRIAAALVVGLLAWASGIASAQATSAPASINPALPTLFLVGNADPATTSALEPLFDRSKINVVDRSATTGIRSTIDGDSWPATLALVRPGDFVLIQFARAAGPTGEAESLPGVNDDARRIPAPAASQPEAIVQTYGWYLRRYAVEAIAHGATPILTAPRVADPTEQGRDEEWTRAIAVQQRIPFVDAVAAAAAGSPAGAAIVAALKGLQSDPLSGYFSPEGNAVPAYQPPPAAAPTAPPL